MADSEPGRFLTLEGGEGAGKSTQVSRLASALKAAGPPVVTTREPGGSPGAEAIRKLLVEGDVGRWDAETELLLHYAARRDHYRRTINPAIATGTWVISDRFADSTMAYQGYGLGIGREIVEALHHLAMGEVRPDLTLILDLPVQDGLARARERDGDEEESNRYERMDVGFHERIRAGFHDIAKRDAARCVLIDAAAGIEETHARICAAVAHKFRVSLNGFPKGGAS